MPPRTARPATTGYERLAQADRFSDDSDDDELHGTVGGGGSGAAGHYASITAQAPRPVGGMAASLPSNSMYHRNPSFSTAAARRGRSNSGVDLKAINARLERWADEIANKFKRRKRSGTGGDDDEERLEIHYSVFQPPEGVRAYTAEGLATSPPTTYSTANVITRGEFESIVQGVRTAINNGTHPRMISQGSSGSYFARNPEGKVVGVFKPKDEEPYAAGNPKWNKWIHRNLFPCCFGRACLIPNLSYVSEAAAYVLDAQLYTHMVPYTDVVYLSSKAFHYPFWDRYSHSRSRKPLPAKPGSFQVFLKGFKDANIFLREHPWPDQYLSGFRTGGNGRSRSRRQRWADTCRPRSKHRSKRRTGGPSGGTSRSISRSGETDGLNGDGNGDGNGNGNYYSDSGAYDEYEDDDDDDEYDDDGQPTSDQILSPENFVWTEQLKKSFREELEKLVILDYIMRNTDRGLDNWMIKVDWSTQAVSIHSEPMHLNMDNDEDNEDGGGRSEQGPRPVDLSQRQSTNSKTAPYPSYKAPKPMDASSPQVDDNQALPSITIGAIDNSLSWPWKHPDAWRSFPFGWLFLPVDLIGRPFSQKTRDHFLPLLTSTAWWSQTQLALRRIFMMDPDFKERMFARQIAVMKGQAWNVVETLKTPDHGPLELTRRAKVCVWDDLVEVPIAVPMRATSSEIRRRAESELARAMEEEMDIGALGSTAAGGSGGDGKNKAAVNVSNGRHSEDLLLGNGSPPGQASSSSAAHLPNPGRFELTKETVVEEDEGDMAGSADRKSKSKRRQRQRQQNGDGVADAVLDGLEASSSPPTSILSTSPRSQKRSSQQPQGASSRASGGAALSSTLPPQRSQQRRYSYTASGMVPVLPISGSSRRSSHSLAQQLFSGSGGGPSSIYGNLPAADDLFYDEDVEGDLGYAAAAGMENNRRRVIVERLEPVKSKNPVFTWC